MKKAVFFDRDGVLIEDVHLLDSIEKIKIKNDNFTALSLLNRLKYLKIVVTNQTVISRGICTEKEVLKINDYINKLYIEKAGTGFDKFYICPHHPNADILKYRRNCNCRKPKPGMLIDAADEFNIDLKKSWMIGDRISDINAGYKAGCRTILLKAKCYKNKPIISDGYDNNVYADYSVVNLLEAVKIITGE